MNGDGVLSRGEKAADDKPGILKQLNESEETQEPSTKLSNGVLAFMMGTQEVASANFTSQRQGNAADDLYRNTYGQYDLDIAS
jgi:hypothetical protein